MLGVILGNLDANLKRIHCPAYVNLMALTVTLLGSAEWITCFLVFAQMIFFFFFDVCFVISLLNFDQLPN